MIRRIEIANFRLLRSVAVDLEPFQVLVGQNGSGKSTLLAALEFIADILELGVQEAARLQAPNFYDLCFSADEPLRFAVEIEDQRLSPLGLRLRYELEIAIDESAGLGCDNELLILVPAERARKSGYSRTEPSELSEFTDPPIRLDAAFPVGTPSMGEPINTKRIQGAARSSIVLARNAPAWVPSLPIGKSFPGHSALVTGSKKASA